MPGVVDTAQYFLGTPYVSGTLEVEGAERLIVDTAGLDCTTFVELSVARWLTAPSDSLSFEQQAHKAAAGQAAVTLQAAASNYPLQLFAMPSLPSFELLLKLPLR